MAVACGACSLHCLLLWCDRQPCGPMSHAVQLFFVYYTQCLAGHWPAASCQPLVGLEQTLAFALDDENVEVRLGDEVPCHVPIVR